ncbi:MAG: chromosomal replication initiator DnaA [Rhizobiales bacterium]|nr:chromosomal replication initiator DnaA [Hyphomicrobiales bacterium]MBO6698726.1 chromosomal replication initiator DnaA [Hyphomicrobiales bacterium]MBO6735021.1 chromosomal replication initiator DnaA [Hyphomicrobiales bacterium]MBO6911173.1 chromosomal replication initiator DnaA [Hyphomicrobiales bacterium]MBO6955683.1 chromosomal replication initiator DnaA [Hyphomicrobiales bacterium]
MSDKQRLRERGVVQARVRQVEACVASVFGVPHESLRASTRGKADVARARQVAMYLCHTVLGFSLTTVGDLFERDRTTVGHACRLVEDLRDRSVFDDQIAYLERAVLAGCLTLVVRAERPSAALSGGHAYA